MGAVLAPELAPEALFDAGLVDALPVGGVGVVEQPLTREASRPS